MSVQWARSKFMPEEQQQEEALSVSVNRCLHQLGRCRAEAGHWKLMTWIFMTGFTAHVLVDLFGLLWWVTK